MDVGTGSLGRLVRGHRLRAGLTQRELAAAAGTSVRTVRDIELDHTRHPHPRSLRGLVIGNRYGEANAWDSTGYAHHHLGQHEEAIACYRRALDRYRGIGDRYNEADVLVHLGDSYAATGDATAAAGVSAHAAQILDELGHPDGPAVRARLGRLPAAAGTR